MSDEDSRFRARYGPWALVAGASMGIGAEFARQLATRGMNLVLVAWPAEGLTEVARAIEKSAGVETRCIALDLSNRVAARSLAEAAAQSEIGLVVYNAALSLIGPFLRQDLDAKLDSVDVNCGGPLILAHEFAGPMVRRGRGGIILMSSLAAFHGTPGAAVYGATKAFSLTLGESLWAELRPSGVDTLVVCPGPTRTPAWERSQPDLQGMLRLPVMEPACVVTRTLEALGRRSVVVTGRANRLSGFVLNRLLSRRAAVKLLAHSMRRVYRT